jgi:hypothetical protein
VESEQLIRDDDIHKSRLILWNFRINAKDANHPRKGVTVILKYCKCTIIRSKFEEVIHKFLSNSSILRLSNDVKSNISQAALLTSSLLLLIGITLMMIPFSNHERLLKVPDVEESHKFIVSSSKNEPIVAPSIVEDHASLRFL